MVFPPKKQQIKEKHLRTGILARHSIIRNDVEQFPIFYNPLKFARLPRISTLLSFLAGFDNFLELSFKKLYLPNPGIMTNSKNLIQVEISY